MSRVARWRIERGGFKPRGTRWNPFDVGSTNRLWRGTGPSGEWLLKWYKYTVPGVHPEPEVGRFLHGRGFTGIPEFGACLDRFEPDGYSTIAYIQRWVSGREAWETVLEAFRRGEDLSSWARELGRQIGMLHAVLASGEAADNPAFRTQAYSAEDHVLWVQRVTAAAEKLHATLRNAPPDGTSSVAWDEARATWHAAEGVWRARLKALLSLRIRACRSRIHGDLHLGQILENSLPGTSSNWWILDFEGEPVRPLEQRRAPDLPLRDVAGIWRSFDYAAAVAGRPPGFGLAPSESFLEGWSEQVPLPRGDWREMLAGLIWEKAVYEALYEIEHRPAWLWVPLRALRESL